MRIRNPVPADHEKHFIIRIYIYLCYQVEAFSIQGISPGTWVWKSNLWQENKTRLGGRVGGEANGGLGSIYIFYVLLWNTFTFRQTDCSLLKRSLINM